MITDYILNLILTSVSSSVSVVSLFSDHQSQILLLLQLFYAYLYSACGVIKLRLVTMTQI